MIKMTLTKESIILIAICTLDLASTLLLLGAKAASEGNPLMEYYLSIGIGTFIMVKLALIVLPIFVAEYSRRYQPQFVRLMLRATIVAYVGIYAVLFLAVNVAPNFVESITKPFVQTQMVHR